MNTYSAFADTNRALTIKGNFGRLGIKVKGLEAEKGTERERLTIHCPKLFRIQISRCQWQGQYLSSQSTPSFAPQARDSIVCQRWWLGASFGCGWGGNDAYQLYRSNQDGIYQSWFWMSKNQLQWPQEQDEERTDGDVDHQQDHDLLDVCGACLHVHDQPIRGHGACEFSRSEMALFSVKDSLHQFTATKFDYFAIQMSSNPSSWKIHAFGPKMTDSAAMYLQKMMTRLETEIRQGYWPWGRLTIWYAYVVFQILLALHRHNANKVK